MTTRRRLLELAILGFASGAYRTSRASSSDARNPPEPVATCCPVLELRQYTLYPGKRDVLIDLFDREFVESQEALGIRIVGQFRDLDRPDRFVWLRGFRDMAARAEALAGFYGGPVWKAHRDAANATMIDSDNVLLLRPAGADAEFRLPKEDRPPPGAHGAGSGLVTATIYAFDSPVGSDFIDFFGREIMPALTDSGAAILARFVTEPSANNFPRLPIREGENVFVWFSRFPDRAAYDRHTAILDRSARWRDVNATLSGRIKGKPETLLLSPTARSLLHG